ncbi:transglutaminase-like cysteine peptidase [Tianweitania sp. BSSL-BM11]|uniref:Transglutaminase-like cysteine peptidase n=1 Tax=Tianweitania aestuarii TaxID=2814886 RepID=A0ABS5RU25_9HYPH|nr:transglutaminase-like cysteine peptidase [Tianweitania aestuarii]MBS9720553.1 transglutaminase-like cysteine peptidase [Tianweitania aestuarii]
MTFWKAFILAAGLLSGLNTAVSSAEAGSFMPVAGRSTQPIGHYEFCQTHADECAKQTSYAGPVPLTRDVWSAIIDVNNAVNTMVTPMTDLEIWGREEVWSYPTAGVGDCEDYALEKRRMLINRGIPSSNLLMTVVRQKNGAGHAVLTVRTSHGDFVLDNLEARVLSWDQTDYVYLKRQSERHAGIWVSIEDGRDLLVGSLKQ